MGSDDFFKKKRAERAKREYELRNVVPKSYLIVSEGTKTEKNYFDGLARYIEMNFGGNIDVITPQITVEGVGRGTCALVNTVAKIVSRANKMYENIWVVFDKDDFQDFDEAIILAEGKNFKVAYSNQCFEYWLFLHFEYSDSALHRDIWERKLDRIFIDRAIRPNGYEKNLANIFDLVTKDHGLKTAVGNAKRQMQRFSLKSKPSQRDPSTTVFRLIEELKDYLNDLW